MDRITTATAHTVSIGTAFYSLLDSFSPQEWTAIGILGGLCLSLLTGIVSWMTNIYFKNKQLKLEQQRNADQDKG
ncbi:lysis protein [Salmonella enterica subsp. enterica serovar Benin]|nr:lysis protein [Salmonella enterica]EIM5532941.1 lysis protein [Salmonella enterica subsp. enterica]ELD8107727.1 lysis protein [Salmonella enterica subsp. enterica serovar Benin]EHP5915511.1 lysis protein [Salmonella enterica]EIE1691048.1 lysis protein [Salmonella enterica]